MNARMSHLSESETGYLAALVDTMTTFYISEEAPRANAVSPAHKLTLVVSSNDRNVLKFWRAKTGLGNLQKSGYGWHWRITAQQAEILLQAVDDLLMFKRSQAKIALSFRATFEGKTHGPLNEEVVRLRREFRQAMFALCA